MKITRWLYVIYIMTLTVCTACVQADSTSRAVSRPNVNGGLPTMGGVPTAVSGGHDKSYTHSTMANFEARVFKDLTLYDSYEIRDPVGILRAIATKGDFISTGLKQQITNDQGHPFLQTVFQQIINNDFHSNLTPSQYDSLKSAIADNLNCYIWNVITGVQTNNKGTLPTYSISQTYLNKLDGLIQQFKDKKDLSDLLNAAQNTKNNDDFTFLLRRILDDDYAGDLFPSPLRNISVPALLKDEEADLQCLHQYLPPERLIYVSAEGIVGGGIHILSPELLFSNERPNFDVGVQSIGGGENGLAFGFRFDLGNLIDSLNRQFAKDVYTLHEVENTDISHEPTVTNDLFNLEQHTDHAAEDYVRAALRPQLAGIFGYSTIDGFGQLTNAGLSASYLRPIGRRPSPGIQALVSTEGIWLTQNSRTQTAARIGYALTIQDESPYLDKCHYEDTYDDSYGHSSAGQRLYRWSWQAGFASTIHNCIDGRTSWALFLRVKMASNTLLTISGGKGSDHKDLFGLSIGMGLPLP